MPYAIATSGRLHSAQPTLELLHLPPGVPVVTRDDVRHAKPDPDLFVAAAQRLHVPMNQCVIVGDSVWDLLAARCADYRPEVAAEITGVPAPEIVAAARTICAATLKTCAACSRSFAAE